MGACGYFLSARAVFFVTALLLAPALFALRMMSANEIDPERAHGGVMRRRDNRPPPNFADLLRQRPLLILAGCVMLFHLANAAMLPLMGSVVTMRSGQWATVLIAACIVVPQVVVAALAPWVGRRAQIWGRRPLLLLAFAALPVRGILFATVKDPNLLVAVQLLDGLTASVFGVMVPLIVADITRGTGHFNVGLGIVGTTTGIGASLSTTLAGYTSDHFGSESAFLGLAAVAALGLAAVWFLLPETRPPRE
jgi:MFS family permease